MFGITALEISFVFKYKKKTVVKNHCIIFKNVVPWFGSGNISKVDPPSPIPNPNTNPQPDKKKTTKIMVNLLLVNMLCVKKILRSSYCRPEQIVHLYRNLYHIYSDIILKDLKIHLNGFYYSLYYCRSLLSCSTNCMQM